MNKRHQHSIINLNRVTPSKNAAEWEVRPLATGDAGAGKAGYDALVRAHARAVEAMQDDPLNSVGKAKVVLTSDVLPGTKDLPASTAHVLEMSLKCGAKNPEVCCGKHVYNRGLSDWSCPNPLWMKMAKIWDGVLDHIAQRNPGH